MKNTISLQKNVSAAERGRYIPIPFDVPEGVERIDFCYTYNGGGIQPSDRNQIDFALECNGALIGASGADRKHLWVSEYSSSDGFKRFPVTAGEYWIILGAYKVSEKGVNVTCDITFTMKERRLFRGDLHTHTTASDGDHTLPQLIDIAKVMKLDFICVTDHNNEMHSPCFSPDEDLTVIPGVEWTHYKGHANFIGVNPSMKLPYYIDDPEQAKKMMMLAHEAGALVCVNHPMEADFGWQWGFDMYYDLIEIWNGMPRMANFAATELWHRQLCANRRSTAVGGSDFHRISALGTLATPTTWVYANSRGISDILEAIRRRRVFTTLSTDGPTVSIECGDAFMGGEAAYKEGKEITFTFGALRENDIIVIRHEADAVRTIKHTESASDMVINIPMERHLFYRAEVARELTQGIPPMPVMLSNPIFIGA